jgi:hypothetical protein
MDGSGFHRRVARFPKRCSQSRILVPRIDQFRHTLHLWVQVSLRRRNAVVTEQLAHRNNIARAIEHIRCKRMPRRIEHVPVWDLGFLACFTELFRDWEVADVRLPLPLRRKHPW